MAGRRPKTVALNDKDTGPIVAGVMEVVSRDRGQLPTHLVTKLSWLSTSGGTRALLVLDSDGRARVLPWEPYGIQVAATRETLIAALKSGDEGTEAQLMALEARYKAAIIGTDHRMSLPPELLAHLDVGGSPPARAFCYLVADHIELYSRSANNSLLSQEYTALSHLP